MDILRVCSGPGAGIRDELSVTIYDVMLKFAVRDPARLWRAAAQLLQMGGLDADDVDETIGTIDDPSIDDCLATILLPRTADGCDVIDFEIQHGIDHDGLYAPGQAACLPGH